MADPIPHHDERRAATVPDAGRQPGPRRRRPGPGTMIWGSVASFALLFGFLVHQLRSGHDPVVGAAAAPKPQQVLVRRVIRRRVITTIVPAAGGAVSGGATVSTSSAPVVSSTAAGSAPVTTSAS